MFYFWGVVEDPIPVSGFHEVKLVQQSCWISRLMHALTLDKQTNESLTIEIFEILISVRSKIAYVICERTGANSSLISPVPLATEKRHSGYLIVRACEKIVLQICPIYPGNFLLHFMPHVIRYLLVLNIFRKLLSSAQRPLLLNQSFHGFHELIRDQKFWEELIACILFISLCECDTTGRNLLNNFKD